MARSIYELIKWSLQTKHTATYEKFSIPFANENREDAHQNIPVFQYIIPWFQALNLEITKQEDALPSEHFSTRFKSIFHLVGLTIPWSNFQWQYQNTVNGVGNLSRNTFDAKTIQDVFSIGAPSIVAAIILIPFVDHLLSEMITARREQSTFQTSTTLCSSILLSTKYYLAALGWTIGATATLKADTSTWPGALASIFASSACSAFLLIKIIGSALERINFDGIDSLTLVDPETGRWHYTTRSRENEHTSYSADSNELNLRNSNATNQPRQNTQIFFRGAINTRILQGENTYCAGFQTPHGDATARLAIAGALEAATWSAMAILLEQSDIEPTFGAVLLGLATSLAFCAGYAAKPALPHAERTAHFAQPNITGVEHDPAEARTEAVASPGI